MGTNGMLRLTLHGIFFNGTGSPQSLYLTAKFGGTVVAGAPSGGVAFGGGNYASDANQHSFRMVLEIRNINSASLQQVLTRATMGPPLATETDWDVISNDHQCMNSVLAKNTASAQTLLVNAQLSASSAALYFILRSAVLELVVA